jgi:hypothetical protein
VRFVVAGVGSPVIIRMERPNINQIFILDILGNATELYDIAYREK